MEKVANASFPHWQRTQEAAVCTLTWDLSPKGKGGTFENRPQVIMGRCYGLV